MKTLPTFAMMGVLLLGGCAASGGNSIGSERSGAAGKVQACRTGDTMVSSSNQCLSDDAACYQIANGSWCTGERGNTCPTGSVAVPAGSVCPSNARCFNYGESLTCAVSG
ncbi:MAG: hypothetical protein KTR35_03380 [Gammaproteobacteria bacterium]|nr:hypothetical protein [Gammaproteobacteria bacterium]